MQPGFMELHPPGDRRPSEVYDGRCAESTAPMRSLTSRLKHALGLGPTLEERALHGDREAWSTLIERHDRCVVAFLMCRGASRPQARDLAQDTWLRLMERQLQGRLNEIRLPGLALHTAKFLLSNARQKRREDLPDRWPPSDVSTRSHEEIVAARCTIDALERALHDLPQRAQDVFRMTYQEHLDAKTIAQRLGLSHNRVRHILSDARKDLRKVLS